MLPFHWVQNWSVKYWYTNIQIYIQIFIGFNSYYPLHMIFEIVIYLKNHKSLLGSHTNSDLQMPGY